MSENIVGPRLRSLRGRLKISQRELARRAEVPSSTVSLIESGKINPSVGALKRLLDAVDLSLSDFFSLEPSEGDQIFFRTEEFREISNCNVSYRMLGPGKTKSSLQILYESYPPGSDSGRVFLTHDGEEGGVILEGQLEVTVGDRTCVLNAGDGYLFNSATPHRFRNIGSVECIVVSACTPPTF
ncbi:MAG: cupin domain-containing protein [Parvularculaceae bacterium]|nr:cupin domain-containing protein [Parvularculaceae bacterium]